MEKTNQNPDARVPSKAMIIKLMEVNGMLASLQKSLRVFAENCYQLIAKNTDVTKKDEFVRQLVDEQKYIDALSRIYTECFTVSEILDLIAFHKSPTGRKFTMLQPEISERMTEVIQDLIGRTYAKIVTKALSDLLDEDPT